MTTIEDLDRRVQALEHDRQLEAKIDGLSRQMREGFTELRTEMRQGFAEVGARLDGHDRKFDQIGAKLDEILRRQMDLAADSDPDSYAPGAE